MPMVKNILVVTKMECIMAKVLICIQMAASIVGEFQYRRYHGKGSYTYADGSVYTGEFKQGLMHGQGILTSKNGSVQKGTWENGKFIK